jgi:hypothetical protein
MKRIFFLMTLVTVMYGLTLPAYADLIDNGGGLIYDTGQETPITWLDAKSNTTMNWDQAVAWVKTLGEGWRLPNYDEVKGQGEMDVLYKELGNGVSQDGGGTFTSGPFQNLKAGKLDEYWYGTDYSVLEPSPGLFPDAWFFSFYYNRNDPDPKTKDDFVYALAVHEGDVAAVPEPNTLLLLGSGLIGMVAFRKKFKK